MTETAHPESHHSRTTPWLWVALVAVLAVGTIATVALPTAGSAPLWPRVAGAVGLAAGLYCWEQSGRDGGDAA